eukprot:scaffold154493_cov35-Tisochrysis_lutea.AAC.1
MPSAGAPCFMTTVPSGTCSRCMTLASGRNSRSGSRPKQVTCLRVLSRSRVSTSSACASGSPV